ncbi:MAG: branched-chain amino acid ABC transporter permease [Rhodospirillum sp.]|nr:branched-chain amino acid ABC transporter permease [Rhodospirillum sp.]MCF8492045.1 branched-chain amino acid ABC transporter permease [Rhodospirillum sp.]MCF8501853.1 branched-chain amino acid ABC transporter permease [Rhodospirillum sp.]
MKPAISIPTPFGPWRLSPVPLLVPALMVVALVLVGSPSTWVTLTLAGLAMGMMIFIMASGLTLVFGLMDVLNFGHGAFISLGAFIGVTIMTALSPWMDSLSLAANLGAIGLGALVAMVVAGGFGYLFERTIIRPVYGDHLKQILITMGGMIVVEQVIYVFWGPDAIPIPRPDSLKGAFAFGDVVLEKYRVLAVVVGLVIFAAMSLTLKRTKIGLLVRAGVENGEMVETLGYRIGALFIAVFVVGSALAGLGGVMWGLYQEVITAPMGMSVMILIFIVVIIGGLGSVEGCFLGALLVGLMNNYAAYLAPKVALGSSILLMVAILMWRPEGLLPAAKGR